jgi:hypothetical protein
VVVVVVAVRGVPVTVMDVVHVVAMRHGHVPAPVAVGVPGVLMRGVLGGLALVPMPLVVPVQVSIVDIVDVVAVRNADMSAAFAVNVLVLWVLEVCGGHRRASCGYSSDNS